MCVCVCVCVTHGTLYVAGTVAGHPLTGTATATFMDTSSGEVYRPDSHTAKLHCPDDCKLEVPTFKTDIAVLVNLQAV